MKVLLLDNYDSFTYNLYHILDTFDGVKTEVIRNDRISIDQVKAFERVVISPGPGIPSGAGITCPLIKSYMHTLPILGVCLGMQAIAEVCGGQIRNDSEVFHGIAKETYVTDKSEKLFDGVVSPFNAGRYHSWHVDKSSLPSELKVTAVDEAGYIMALRHENNLLRGIQFHPESVLTEYGKLLISNWLFLC